MTNIILCQQHANLYMFEHRKRINSRFMFFVLLDVSCIAIICIKTFACILINFEWTCTRMFLPLFCNFFYSSQSISMFDRFVGFIKRKAIYFMQWFLSIVLFYQLLQQIWKNIFVKSCLLNKQPSLYSSCIHILIFISQFVAFDILLHAFMVTHD